MASRRQQRLGTAAGMLSLLGLIGLAANADTKATPTRSLNLPPTPERYADLPFPAHFDERVVRTLDNTPAENPTTDAGATLGRALFYDTRLSANGTTSCGSCHQQSRAFAGPDRVDAGYQGKRGDRNAMSLVNLRFTRGRFFWDERKSTLEEAVLTPIHSRLELGHTSVSLTRAVAADKRYTPLFQAAFGSSSVTEERIGRALAQFVRSLVSINSRYDQAAAEVKTTPEDFPAFTAQENQGKRLFLQRCNTCHHLGEGQRVTFFGMFRSLDNGIDPDRSARDGGLGDVTLNPSDVGVFKSPDLRNVGVTAPYMHDGRFKTLEEVIDHYASAPQVQPAGRFTYTAEDKASLVAFMKTLTDAKFLTDLRFSDPWKGPIPARPASPAPFLDATRTANEPSTPAERLAQGKTLRVGESLPWLRSLDQNGDGLLAADEYAAVAQILVRSGVERLTNPERVGRGGRRVVPGTPPSGSPATPPAEVKDGFLLGDFNADGTVDEMETRLLASLKRQIEMGDGGRLETIMDRQFSRFTMTAGQLVEARHVFRTGKQKLYAQTRTADSELQAKLQSLLTPEQFGRYQDLVIRGVQTNPSEKQTDPTARLQETQKQLLTFDRSSDGHLDAKELTELAKVLDELPGGFGRPMASLAQTNEFQRRLLKNYAQAGKETIACAQLPERMHQLVEAGDTDRNGFLTPREVEVYVRKTAFKETVDVGIYIGGGFGDAFVETAPVLAELELPQERREAAQALLAQHAKRLEALNAQAVREILPRFQGVTQKKTVSAKP